MALAIALLLAGVLLPCWGEFALFKKGSTKVSQGTFRTFLSSRGRWPGHHSPSRRGQLGLEREVGDGAGEGTTPYWGFLLRLEAWCAPRGLQRPCFTSLVALEVKESGLTTSSSLSLPSPPPLFLSGMLSPAPSHALHTCPGLCPSLCPSRHPTLSSFSFLLFLSTPFSVPSPSPTKV